MKPPTRAVRFGQYVFELESLQLTLRGRPVPLQPQPSRVLAHFVRNGGRLVTREELRDLLWPDRIVEYEKGLNTAIRQVRDALGERAGAPVFLETVPRRGYRFIAPVVEIDDAVSKPALAAETLSDPAEPPEHSTAVARATPGRTWTWLVAAAVLGLLVIAGVRASTSGPDAGRRVLVLPFQNLTTDPDLDILAGGISEEIRADLASRHPADIAVIARTTAERYARTGETVGELGDALDVGYVLEGSIHEDGDAIRIVARLIAAEHETPLWQDGLRGAVTETRGFASRIGQRVAQSVGASAASNPAITQSDPGPSEPAVRLTYLKARYFLSLARPSALRRAATYFEAVVDAAPGYAPAHAGLAETRLWTGNVEGARAAAQHALALDPELSEAHRVLGGVLLTRDFDIPAAGSHLRRALDLAPGRPEAANAYAFYLALTGDHDGAIELVERTIALDPLSAALNGDVGIYYYWAERYDQAIHYCRLATELDSTQVFGHRCHMWSLDADGQRDRAVEQLHAVMSLEGATPEEIAAVIGRGNEALSAYRAWRLSVLEKQPSDGSSLFERAQHYAATGAYPEALDCLEGALADPPLSLVTIGVDPVFAPLRTEPRFRLLSDRLGLGTP